MLVYTHAFLLSHTVHVCLFRYVHILFYTYICVHMYTYVYRMPRTTSRRRFLLYVCLYIYIYIYMFLCVLQFPAHVCMYACMHVCFYACFKFPLDFNQKSLCMAVEQLQTGRKSLLHMYWTNQKSTRQCQHTNSINV